MADSVGRYVAAGAPVPERVYLYGGTFNPARVLAAFRDNAPSWNVLLRDFADREGTLATAYDSVLADVRAARRGR